MKTIGLYEARTHFSQVVEDVERGETYSITKHGVVVAHLVPGGGRRIASDDALRRLQDFNKGRRLGIPIKRAVEQGRP